MTIRLYYFSFSSWLIYVLTSSCLLSVIRVNYLLLLVGRLIVAFHMRYKAKIAQEISVIFVGRFSLTENVNDYLELINLAKV